MPRRAPEGLWDRLHAAFHRPSTPQYRAVDRTVWLLIVLSVVLLVIEPFVVGRGERITLRAIDFVILALFGIELTLRVLTFRPPALEVFARAPLGTLRTHVLARLSFLLKPMQIIDLITIVAVVPALRGLRVLRLLRLLRTARVFRYGNPFAGLISAFETDRLLFSFAFGVLGVETVLGGITLYLLERDEPGAQVSSMGEGIWWALVTLTTVGYGDYAPVGEIGRAWGAVLMVGGMFTLALFAGVVGHSLLNAVLSIREEQFRMSSYVNHVVVCGYEEGRQLLLESLQAEIDLEETKVVLFSRQPRPREVPPELMWVHGDPTKQSELGKVRMTHARSAIVVGSRTVTPQLADAATILTVFTIRAHLELQKEAATRERPLHIVAEILDSENVGHARTAGADEVIESQRLGFAMLTHTVAYPGVGDLTSQIVASGAASFYVGAQPDGLPIPLTFGELARAVKARHDALVIGLRDPVTRAQTINPRDDLPVPEDAEVVYIAESPTLEPTHAEPR